jgi:GH15 family glucan-1,4-alpha-glucosidase
MTNIYDVIYESYKNNRIKQEKIEKVKAEIEKYNVEIKKYILNNLYDDNKKVLKRNTLDENSDISILGIVTPFEIFSPSEKKVQNTVNKIEMTLRTFSRRLLKI